MIPQEEWNRCSPWIDAALRRTGFYEIADIERELEAGNMTFWPGKKAAAITEFVTYPNGKALNVFAGGGENNESLDEFMEVFEPTLTNWAEINNCRWIMGYGRPGWVKPCLAAGYTHTWNVMTKEIHNGR